LNKSKRYKHAKHNEKRWLRPARHDEEPKRGVQSSDICVMCVVCCLQLPTIDGCMRARARHWITRFISTFSRACFVLLPENGHYCTDDVVYLCMFEWHQIS
jgi:hypothetical protein